MQFYTKTHNRYCGIDLYAKTMYRLVKCQSSSAGKIKGTSGAKMGNVHLKWAFSEVAVLMLAKCPEGKKLVDRLAKKNGKGKALSILAHRIGRAASRAALRDPH